MFCSAAHAESKLGLATHRLCGTFHSIPNRKSNGEVWRRFSQASTVPSVLDTSTSAAKNEETEAKAVNPPVSSAHSKASIKVVASICTVNQDGSHHGSCTTARSLLKSYSCNAGISLPISAILILATSMLFSPAKFTLNLKRSNWSPCHLPTQVETLRRLSKPSVQSQSWYKAKV